MHVKMKMRGSISLRARNGSRRPLILGMKPQDPNRADERCQPRNVRENRGVRRVVKRISQILANTNSFKRSRTGQPTTYASMNSSPRRYLLMRLDLRGDSSRKKYVCRIL